ncbi:MAG: hypothetical protein EOO10_01145 [Chitinophagaceae bacterium]|nr:MAG: hypothetical protein EOO10_01145 [Chitinophagaceae bacterium]
MKRKIILGIVILIVVAGSIAAWKYFEKSTNYVAKDPDVTVTAKELVAAFESDIATASKRFMDKIVRVTGAVKSFDSSAVVLGEEGPSDVVIGLDDRNSTGIGQIKIGETVTLQGKFSGYSKTSGDGDDLLSSLGGTTVNIDYAGVVKKQ